MDIDVFSARELPTVFRVLRTTLNPDGELTELQRRFLQTYASICGCAPLQGDPLPVAARTVNILDVHRRKRLLQLAAIATLFNRPVNPRSAAYLKELEFHLVVSDPVTAVIEAVLQGKPFKARMLTMRRMMRVMAKEARLKEGWKGVARMFAALALKAPVNMDKLWRYKRLGMLPDGTLGREYWKHMTDVGFGFPGEPAGIPDSIAYHDVAHVLAGHDTTPLGEIQQGSFQGGNRREDGFFFIQFVILQFHQGIKITPVAPPATDNFIPEKVLWAIHRGARCNVDVTHQWNFWPLMELPIEEARERVALMPALA